MIPNYLHNPHKCKENSKFLVKIQCILKQEPKKHINPKMVNSNNSFCNSLIFIFTYLPVHFLLFQDSSVLQLLKAKKPIRKTTIGIVLAMYVNNQKSESVVPDLWFLTLCCDRYPQPTLKISIKDD